MVRFIAHEGLICPMLVCDYCGEVIEKPSAALIGCTELDTPAVALHKGSCDRGYGERFARVVIWDEVEKVLSDLSHNTICRAKERNRSYAKLS